MDKVVLPIDKKSLFLNIFNDNEYGHTATVSTPIKQGNSTNKKLAQIFKDVQMIILEQGTILDRIDYNIEIAVTNVGMAKKELIKADNSMRSSCARNANLSLIITIFVLGLLLIFKFIK